VTETHEETDEEPELLGEEPHEAAVPERLERQPEKPRQERASGGGMIPRRIEMPIGLWNEVLELSRSGGVDYRDTLLALLDLGIQSQAEGRFKPRFVALDGKVLERVTAVTAAGQTQEAALVQLVDMGLQARLARGLAVPPPPPPDGTRVRVDVLPGMKRLIECFMNAVPAPGDLISVQGESYEVQQRAWTVAVKSSTAYLRVRAYGGSA
jgi:hypothetical protein